MLKYPPIILGGHINFKYSPIILGGHINFAWVAILILGGHINWIMCLRHNAHQLSHL